MPLITSKSPEAFSDNIKAEMSAGRPQAQSIAIAYAKKREAMRRKKLWRGGYAAGGAVAPDEQDQDLMAEDPYMDDQGDQDDEHPLEFMDEGGIVGEEDMEPAMKEDYGPPVKFEHALKRRLRRFRT